MKQRQLPPTGGGPPIIAAGGRPISLRKDVAPAPITLTLSISPESEAAGKDVLQRVRDACNRDAFELISSVVVLFPNVTARTPEFHGLMDELVQGERRDVIGKIFRVPGRRGPKPHNQFHLIALIEHVMTTEKLDHATEAIARLAEVFAEERAKPITDRERELLSLPGEKRLQNLHTDLHELFRLWTKGIYIPGEQLTAQPWLPPGYQPEQRPLVATKLSNAIVFHAPEDEVTEPKKEN
ncbi:MAG: hypothetical protein JO257_03540 [Deltaproteobacteria bacterium]|nr:hypothetical protein [Deltaproteobacteria bacterium]